MAQNPVYFRSRFKPLLNGKPKSAFDVRTAWLMAEMAHLAYRAFEKEGFEVLRKPLRKGGFALVNAYDVGGTQAFLAMRAGGDMAVLCFRGTDDLWLS